MRGDGSGSFALCACVCSSKSYGQVLRSNHVDCATSLKFGRKSTVSVPGRHHVFIHGVISQRNYKQMSSAILKKILYRPDCYWYTPLEQLSTWSRYLRKLSLGIGRKRLADLYVNSTALGLLVGLAMQAPARSQLRTPTTNGRFSFATTRKKRV